MLFLLDDDDDHWPICCFPLSTAERKLTLRSRHRFTPIFVCSLQPMYRLLTFQLELAPSFPPMTRYIFPAYSPSFPPPPRQSSLVLSPTLTCTLILSPAGLVKSFLVFLAYSWVGENVFSLALPRNHTDDRPF